MANEIPVDQTNRPLQMLSYSEKDNDWYKANANHYISRCNFIYGSQTSTRKNLLELYEVYNNQFPLSWFKHITNPLSSSNAAHKAFPAKVRPVTILRTNIDLLLGEWPRRPFVYNVENLGENGYIRYTEGLSSAIKKNLDQLFIQTVLREAQAMGEQLTPEQLQQLEQEPPLPDQVKEAYHASYKDAIAIKGQKWLRRVIREKNIKKKLHKMFKHWLIAGMAFSYKGVVNEGLVYEDISPLQIDYDKDSDSSEYIEDGEWVVCRRLYSLSSVVDRYWSQLKEQEQKDLERQYWFSTPATFYDHMRGLYTSPEERNKIPVFHVQWKGRRKVGFVTYFDFEVMDFVEKKVDEDYVVGPGERVEWKWVNVVHECERIGDIQNGIYVNMREVQVQRNEMNNASACKLSYNGRKYSDLHADNISVLELGLPFQVMVIILNYVIEKTIAKSKGKIVLLDKNAVPNEGDWDDEKFFYYADALGYGLLDRNQIGVDKSWNQYQVLDMTLFEYIKELINLMDYYKQQWDDVIGITRQRKGQTYASDLQGVNERAVFQSTVITDMIFSGFEELIEKELQGIMDYAKFLTAKGVRSVYNDDEFGTQLMEIDPEDFPNEDLGVFVDGSAEHIRKLNEMKGYAQAMLQNNARPSTVMEVIDSVNAAELKMKLKRIEEIEMQLAQQNAADEQEKEQALLEIQQRHDEYKELLKRGTMHEEYDRKEDIEYIKGSFNTFTYQDGDSNDNNVPDAVEVAYLNLDQQKILADVEEKRANRKLKQQEADTRRKTLEHQIEKDKKDHALAKEKLKIDRKKANQKPKTKQ